MNYRSEIYANKWGVIRNIMMSTILLFLIVVCFFIVDRSVSCDNIGTTTTILCSDNNDCTFDFPIQNNQSCVNYNKPNGAPCDLDQLCYNHSLCTPGCSLCVNGDCDKPQCIGPVSCCQGLCLVDNDCVSKVEFLSQGSTASCLNGRCLYSIYNTQKGNQQQCLDLVDGPIKNCLHASVGDSAAFDGICFYNFICAPPTTGTLP
jgi:hypothetical protein